MIAEQDASNIPSTLNNLTELSSIDDQSLVTRESMRFNKHSALITLIIMSFGPLSLLCQTIGETIDMALISYRFKNDPDAHAVEILGFTTQSHIIIVCIGLFFGQTMIARISYLIGSNNRAGAAHLISEILYLDIVFSMIFASIFVFLVKPILRFLGSSDELISNCFLYVVTGLVALPFTTLSSLGQYFLQSIGNSILSALVKFVTYALQLSIFSPFFLFLVKVPVIFMKLGSLISNSIVGIGIFILIYREKFSLKPNIRDVFDHFTPELKKALTSSVPLLLHAITAVIPAMLILKSMTGVDPDRANAIAGVFAVYTQILGICVSFPGAFSQGFLSAATHAWGANNYKRVVRLFSWALLICIILPIAASIAMIVGTQPILKIFLHTQKEIDLGMKMLPIPFYTCPLQGFCVCVSMMMIVVGKPIMSFIPQCVQFAILCIGCNVIARYCNHDPTKIMYIYNIADITNFVLLLLFLIYPIRLIKKKMDEKTDTYINATALLE